jgi:hypothetical protein|tara:strand:- start:594 stop:989 length:396 start_codon:yes stop_codon:yes gene_type:complete
MTKLCPRGKAAAKRKFRVYPSAYANAYASKICAGKIKDPSGVKRKDFKGPKPAGKVSGGEAKIKKVIGGLKKASRTHAAQAKTLQSVVKASSGKFAQTLEPYTGTYIKGNLAGHEVSNKSYKNYYKGMLDD